MAAPCEDWLDDEDLEDCIDDPGDVDLESLARLVSILMFRLSGSQFTGVCGPVTVAPYERRRCDCHGCSCCRPFLRLRGPIVEVDEIRLDGVALDPASWRIAGARRIERVGGHWPCPNAPGRLEVDYTFGTPIPDEGIHVAKLLGCQMLRSALNLPCDLPFNASQIVRSGVTVSLEDRDTALGQGRTGVPEVDAWLMAVNPYGRTRRAAIFRADDPRRHAVRPV